MLFHSLEFRRWMISPASIGAELRRYIVIRIIIALLL